MLATIKLAIPMRDTTDDELNGLLIQLEAAQNRFNEASAGYIDTTILELRAAELRIQQLLREKRNLKHACTQT